MSRARDSQRAKVYAWERASIPGWAEGEWKPTRIRRFRGSDGQERTFPTDRRCRIAKEMALADCAALVARVWADYRPGATPPRVTPGFLARSATGCRDRVNLPRWARQEPVVLHETAHSLLPAFRRENNPDDYFGGRVVYLAWHGPEFVRLFIELLVRYHRPCRGQRAMLLRTARAAKIKVGRLSDCPKPVTRLAESRS